MTETPNTWLVVLSRDRCEELLRTAEIGRLGVVIDGRPTIFPVCHVFLDGVVAFPTNVGSKLHGALDWPYVAFEVDGLDASGSSGWSVMVAGRAEEIEEPEVRDRLASLRRSLWRTGQTSRWIRIVPSEISGRTITGPAG